MVESGYYKKYEPIFGSWYIVRRIGRGAIGQVFEIQRRDMEPAASAALKAISIPEGPEDIQSVMFSGVAREDLKGYYQNLMKTVVTEFQYLAKLKGNSHIVSYEDHQIIEHEDGIGWDILIKTELLTPLVEYSIDHPFSEEDVLKLGIDICRALEFCSDYDIIHRDIKPENIFLAPGGDFKLGDFGIARVVEETQMSLSRKGTYSYMAPEVFHGHHYGQSADIYSLGIVMYKYLNHGRNPFMPPYPEKIVYEDSEKAFVQRMAGKPMPNPSQGSRQINRIIRKACSHKAEDRYQTAREMRQELEKLYVARSRKSANKAGTPGDTAQDLPEVSDRRETAGGDTFWSPWKKRAAAIALVIGLCLGIGIFGRNPERIMDISGVPRHVSMYYDGSMQLDCRAEPGKFRDEPLIFTSGDEKVFTVSDQGLLTAGSIGEAELTLKAANYEEKVRISVIPKVTAINGIKETYKLTKGKTKKLKPSLSPEKFAGEAVTFSSADPAIAKVSKKGKITAVKKGTTTITVAAGGISTSCTVKVKDPPPEPVVTVDESAYSGSMYSSSGGSSGSSTKKKSSSKKSSKKSSSKSSGGYFSSSDDEYFD